MFNWFRTLLLRLLRVPPEPEPPFGEPGSVRVFRASRKLYWLRLIGWTTAQIAALAGILFWIGALLAMESETRHAQGEAAAQGRRTPALKPGRHRPLSQAFKDVAARVPGFVYVLLWFGKGVGVLVYLGQLGITYAAVRLDYEMRWYMVTDRSLRIRSGLWKVEELTLSFANLQHVMLAQGPLQRLLGIADLHVQSAGGGGGGQNEHSHGNPMHIGIFRGVEDAVEIRDLILDRLRHFRETGLGDPDEGHLKTLSPPSPDKTLSIAAARELLAEAQQLRQTVDGLGRTRATK